MKKITSFLLIMILVFTPVIRVEAKILTISEVFNHFKTNFIDEMNNNNGGKMNATLDTANKVIKITGETGSEEVVINYTDDYLEYVDSTTEITEQTTGKDIAVFMIFAGLFNSVASLSGYADIAATDNSDSKILDDLTTTYDKYGVEMITEKYDISTENMQASGDHIKTFKISLDTEKMDALVKEMKKQSNDASNTQEKTPVNQNDNTNTSIDNNNNNESQITKKNPETGAFIPTVAIIGLFISSIVLLKTRKRVL